MIPVRLELNNFRSHTHSVVDFDFSSALIVGEDDNDGRKSNGVGKSSIFEGICWALFGYLEKRQADSVVRWGQPTCEVTLDFIQDNQKYRIVRTRIARYSKMVTQFFKMPERDEDFDPEDDRFKMHGDSGKITELAICDILKSNYEVFVNSSYFRQGSFFEFASGTDATRHALLGSLLNLERWNLYRKEAKAQLDNYNEKVAELRHDLEKTDGAEDQLKNAKATLASTKEQIYVLTNENTVLEDGIAALEVKVAGRGKQRSDLYRFNELKKQQSLLESQRLDVDRQFSVLKDKFDSNEVNIAKNTAAKEELEGELLLLTESISKTDVPLLRSRISSMEEAILEGRTKKKVITARIENLIGGDECSLCGNPWDDHEAKLGTVSKNEIELEELESKLSRAHSKLIAARGELDARRVAELSLEKLEARMETLCDNISRDTTRNAIILKEQAVLVARLPEIEDGQAANKALLDDMADVEKLKEPDTLHSHLEAKKTEYKANAASLSALAFTQGSLTETEKTLSVLVKERKELKVKLAAQTRLAAIFGQLSKGFSREGVPAIIIDNVIEDLTRATNEWLSKICTKPTRISFITQKQSNKGDWKETMDIAVTTAAGECNFADLSGGEQFRVAFGLRLALSSLQSRRLGGETQLLLLDEVSTSLDPYGIDIFVSIIRQLERTMKVLVITHDNNLKDEFERVITVKGDGNGSSAVEM